VREILLFVAILSSVVLLSACQSLEQAPLFASGHDERTFNPQTGRYEWPKESEPPKPRASVRNERPAESSKNALLNSGDERVFNPQTGRYEWPRE